MKKTIVVALCTLLITACAQQAFRVHPGNPAQPTKLISHDFIMAGIGQSEAVNGALACGGDPQKIAGVEMQQSASDSVIAVLTLGIYSPRTVRVYCNP